MLGHLPDPLDCFLHIIEGHMWHNKGCMAGLAIHRPLLGSILSQQFDLMKHGFDITGEWQQDADRSATVHSSRTWT